jgi:ubiquinol-cytochrome c reductase cytochrome b subunit
MGGALIILFFLPFINTSKVRSTFFRPFFHLFFWVFISNFLILGWVGQKVVETPFIEIGQIATVYYFVFFLVFIPVLGIFESFLIKNKIRTKVKLKNIQTKSGE